MGIYKVFKVIRTLNMAKVCQIPESNFFEVIVVGGGPCALAVTSRLCEETPGAIYSDGEHQRFRWLKKRGNKSNVLRKSQRALVEASEKFKPDDILVIDRMKGGFLGQWDNQFDAVKIPHLRSPMFFHPDPLDIDGLVAFAYSQGREKELMEIKGVVGREITKHRQKKMRSKRKTSEGCPNKLKPGRSVGLVEIDQRDWKDYYRPGSKLFRDFCQSVIERYGLENVVQQAEVVDIKYQEIQKMFANGDIETGMGFQIETSSGEVFGCKVAILAVGPAGKINYPISKSVDYQYLEGSCHTTDLFMHRVPFPSQRVQAEIERKRKTEIVIVGGGLTSAQLSELALKEGVSKVHLVTRGEIKIKHFDFHLEWVSKYQNYMKSTFWMKDTDDERYQMIDDAREGGSVNPQYHKVLMKLIEKGKVVLYKHSEIKDHIWSKDAQKWETVTIMDNLKHTTVNLSNIDYVYYATGSRADIGSQAFMQNILQDHPIDIIHGLPCLTDDLQWNADVPLFMIGRFASLRTGPSSANLDGGRLGAERVGWQVQNLKKTGQLEFSKAVSIDAKIPGNILKLVESQMSCNLREAYNEPATGFENLLSCTGGSVNWYSFLADTSA